MEATTLKPLQEAVELDTLDRLERTQLLSIVNPVADKIAQDVAGRWQLGHYTPDELDRRRAATAALKVLLGQITHRDVARKELPDIEPRWAVALEAAGIAAERVYAAIESTTGERT